MLAKNQDIIDLIADSFKEIDTQEIKSLIAEVKQNYMMYNVLANDQEMQIKGGEVWRKQFDALQDKVVAALKKLRQTASEQNIGIEKLFEELNLDEY
jgi:cytochrome c556